MMMKDTLPLVKSFFQIGSFDQHAQNYIVRMIIAFIFHTGRMSASQVASSVRTDVRHRAQVTRFLIGSSMANGSGEYSCLATALVDMESRHQGRWLFAVDKTCCSRQGNKTQNTFSTGNRKRRPRKGRRYSKKKNAPKRCHGFVMGLLIKPSGYRIPLHRCYYTKDYCKKKTSIIAQKPNWALK